MSSELEIARENWSYEQQVLEKARVCPMSNKLEIARGSRSYEQHVLEIARGSRS